AKAQPKPMPNRPQPAIPPELAKLYSPKPGYANYYFNKLEQDRLLGQLAALGDFKSVAGNWDLEGSVEIGPKKSVFRATSGEEADRTQDGKPVVRAWTYHLKPETLPGLPEADEGEEKMPLRVAVRKAATVLRKHATSFPQEFFGKEDAEFKAEGEKIEKDAA